MTTQTRRVVYHGRGTRLDRPRRVFRDVSAYGTLCRAMGGLRPKVTVATKTHCAVETDSAFYLTAIGRIGKDWTP